MEIVIEFERCQTKASNGSRNLLHAAERDSQIVMIKFVRRKGVCNSKNCRSNSEQTIKILIKGVWDAE